MSALAFASSFLHVLPDLSLELVIVREVRRLLAVQIRSEQQLGLAARIRRAAIGRAGLLSARDDRGTWIYLAASAACEGDHSTPSEQSRPLCHGTRWARFITRSIRCSCSRACAKLACSLRSASPEPINVHRDGPNSQNRECAAKYRPYTTMPRQSKRLVSGPLPRRTNHDLCRGAHRTSPPGKSHTSDRALPESKRTTTNPSASS